MRRPLALLAAFAACATHSPAPVAAESPAPASPSALAAFGADTRAALDALVAVDTSHGHETDVLKPLADRLRPSMAVELLESAPGHGNLIARFKGSGAKRPLLLIAHVDVVPVEGQPWTVPPFQITEKDGYLWGRGVNDDKAMAAVMVALASELVRTRPKLSRDVIFAFTSGEETGGASGAEWLAQNHKELIDAEYALNEGGSIRLDDDGARIVEVGLGAAEKTFQSYRFVVRGKGGHSSIPPTDSDPVLTLSRALVKVGEFRFPARVIPATREELAADAKLEKPPLSDAEARVATQGKVSDDDERVLATDRMVNAHLRTTCVTTQLQASPQDNVLPTSAEAIVNCRILPDETREQTTATLTRLVGDPSVEIAPVADFGFGPYSPADGEISRALKKVVGGLWPGTPVVTTMGTGATDSRHLRAIGIRAYGLSVSPVTRAEGLAGRVAHGPDERRPARWLPEGAEFLRRLTYELAR
ncbi:MAG TPA: M20/M25/M40 family metallo-hydrolase [Polyangiaceae bacterium]|jgi:acetylornithine deacetylase/succinyl-diaminopimelate desuccinylase-like protein|nr:M20/M25/M40 family metallo-hydrolase [Polyangiaceae bacterium]